MIDNKAIELWQTTNKLLARIASALEKHSVPEVPHADRNVVRRYQACASRLWAMFPGDPLPPEHPARAWVERLEALLNHGMLGPVRLRAIRVCPHCKRVDSLCNDSGDKAWCKTCSKEVKPELMP